MIFHKPLNPALVVLGMIVSGTVPAAPATLNLTWTSVVNNGDFIPTDTCNPSSPTSSCEKTFNSYNQPSVNSRGLVVFRARGKGPGEPPHGIYTRNMQSSGPVVRITDRTSEVPQPNNLGTTFIEFPSFPRIDIDSRMIATRGNSEPVWKYVLPDGTETRAGTTGIFTTPKGPLITGISKLGAVPEFSYFQVPGADPGTTFDVFPGSPSPTSGGLIAFKGNYTDLAHAGSETGVYFRSTMGSNGKAPVQLIANNVTTLIPGTTTVFGSTAPPSAAANKAVFAGFDSEENPTLGGIYLTNLKSEKDDNEKNENGQRNTGLKVLVNIGSPIPDLPGARFELFGESLSFDGRYVGFWAAWNKDNTREVKLHCSAEGNKDRRDFCLTQCPEPDGCAVKVPINQGFFVYDVEKRRTRLVSRTGRKFADFLFWNFSGKVPGVGEGDEDGEPARWRSAAFVAVNGGGDRFQAAFKALEPDGRKSISMGAGSSKGIFSLQTLVDTTTPGERLDPAAAGLTVSELGLERDAFRNGQLVINASMGSEETGWAGIYLTTVRQPRTDD